LFEKIKRNRIDTWHDEVHGMMMIAHEQLSIHAAAAAANKHGSSKKSI